MRNMLPKHIIKSRSYLPVIKPSPHKADEAAEGGCGVIGLASNTQIAGRHLLQALIQMRNRGNGKGGGVAIVGLNPAEFGVTQQQLNESYLLAIAYIDQSVRREVEENHIYSVFNIEHTYQMPHLPDHTVLNGLDIKPPEVVLYFSKIKEQVYEQFINENNLQEADRRTIEDEIVYQNSFLLNQKYYASTGETKAFVLSHGKNLLVLKMVGYGDDVVRYYQLENIHGYVWIGHHRYPTKGRVWHPGGAHPFVGLNEALVHNGDFANYASMSEYLSQRNIYPLFLTDTEVSVLVFDLLHRTYGYPLEYVIEALAPTTERDFACLPPEKQSIYKAIQTTHIHGSPDGPWFFLIAQSAANGIGSGPYRLIGITDTSMLRPQVFALQHNPIEDISIGFAASEKQAIDAALESISQEDPRFWSHADIYWNARGGSHTDGGAFIFSVTPNDGEKPDFRCTNKFGETVSIPANQKPYSGEWHKSEPYSPEFEYQTADELIEWFIDHIPTWTYDDVLKQLQSLTSQLDENALTLTLALLTALIDRRYPTGAMRRSYLLSIYDSFLDKWLAQIKSGKFDSYCYVNVRQPDQTPSSREQIAVVDSRGFSHEGQDSLARAIVELYKNGFRQFKIFHAQGHRFIGNGFGPDSHDTRIDVYGSPGDYLGSGLDGAEIYVHNNGQDQLAQITKSGKLVVYGDVGQTFGYAAKGGEMFILGNAAGRPMINAVGKPRVVINGTCLDYLAESFMAGDPLNGGGFVILNGIKVETDGTITDLESPYPGGNLFSLASGGAIFIRDPQEKISADQLNGGEFDTLTEEDWQLIRPYLEENARLFNIPVSSLLGNKRPDQVYRKIRPRSVRALMAEEAWVKKINHQAH